jgi:hypothetical protein
MDPRPATPRTHSSLPTSREEPAPPTRRSVLAWSLASVPVLSGALAGCHAHPAGLEPAGRGPRRGRGQRGRPGRTRPAVHAEDGPRPLLTETVGLLMQYGASRGVRPIFDEQLSRVLHHLRSPCGLLSWRASADLTEVAPSSASIDDLTVVRALLDGAERWDHAVAHELATEIAAAVMEHQVHRGLLVDA